MSLNWNLTKTNRRATGRDVVNCNNDSHDGDCQKCPKIAENLIHDAAGQPIPWAVTNGLIWATMAVQMGGIYTEKEAREFSVRLAIYQRLFGPFLTGGESGKGRKITTAEVKAHVGMSTNVTNRTRGAFLKSMGEVLAREVAEEVSSEIEEAKPEIPTEQVRTVGAV